MGEVEEEEDMIEPLYEDDISTIIQDVRPEDVQHFENEKFIRVPDGQMPDLLKFIDESEEYQFDDWAIIGETRAEEESPIPGSSEDPAAQHRPKPQHAPIDADVDAEASGASSAAVAPPQDLFDHVDRIETREEEEEEEEQEAEEGEEQPNEVENSMVFSMFLSNWEDQVRQIREAKRLEWEKKMKELLGNEADGGAEDGDSNRAGRADGGEVFLDEDGDSWVLIEGDQKKAATKPDADQLQVAVACQSQQQQQVATRSGFFENWPSFNVGSKLGVVLTATGTSFCFGFLMGARAAMDSFYRLCERPFVAGVVGLTAAYAVSIQPTVLMTAVKYIILGGVMGGTAVATPVFVVGTTGVFVSAAVYHAWIAAKRGVVRAVTSPSRPKPRALPASPATGDIKPILVPLKSIHCCEHDTKKHQ